MSLVITADSDGVVLSRFPLNPAATQDRDSLLTAIATELAVHSVAPGVYWVSIVTDSGTTIDATRVVNSAEPIGESGDYIAWWSTGGTTMPTMRERLAVNHELDRFVLAARHDAERTALDGAIGAQPSLESVGSIELREQLRLHQPSPSGPLVELPESYDDGPARPVSLDLAEGYRTHPTTSPDGTRYATGTAEQVEADRLGALADAPTRDGAQVVPVDRLTAAVRGLDARLAAHTERATEHTDGVVPTLERIADAAERIASACEDHDGSSLFSTIAHALGRRS